MFPYVEPPAFTIGSHTIHAFGLLAFTAVVVGVSVVVLRAPKLGFDREEALNIVTWTVVSGFVGSHLFSELAYYPQRVLADPWRLLRLTGTMSSFGGIAGGLLGGFVVMRRQGRSKEEIARFVDGIAFAFPLAWIFGRAGCALAHDHLGVETTSWLAVRFPDGPRFDLGLLELLLTVPIAVLFVVLDRRRRPTGLYVGLFFALYGPARFAMDVLRVEDARYFGWTPSQALALVMAGIGIALLAAIRRRAILH